MASLYLLLLLLLLACSCICGFTLRPQSTRATETTRCCNAGLHNEDVHSSFSYQPLLDAIHSFSPPSSTSTSISTSTNNSTDAVRVFHGRGWCYAGCEHLTLDWFPPVFVLTSFQDKRLSASDLTVIANSLGNATWVYQSRAKANQSSTTTRVMAGTVPDPHIVTENQCQYFVQITSEEPSGGTSSTSTTRKHHGLFLDMANGRKWVRENAHGKNILNLFSYTCAFSVAALAQPPHRAAQQVINIDKVPGVLKLGHQNHQLNRIPPGKARFFRHDIFKSWGKVKRLGPYDIIVCDPPSYQPGSFVAAKDYAKLIRRLPGLLTANGYALLCLNAPELSIDFLEQQVQENAPQLQLVQRIPNPDSFPEMDDDRALKVLLYQLTQASVEDTLD